MWKTTGDNWSSLGQCSDPWGFYLEKIGGGGWLEVHHPSQSVVNNHGDRKSPIPGVIPLPNGLFIAYKWG